MTSPHKMEAPSETVDAVHEVVGSVLLSVQRSLLKISTHADQVRHLLGEPSCSRLEHVLDDGWYPIEWMLEMTGIIDRKIGPFGLMKLGRVLFKQTHAAVLRERRMSGRDLVYGLDAMYRADNRGDRIGGWQVLSFDDHAARLRKTTPHHCMMEEGIVSEALKCAGAPSLVRQSECMLSGAEACTFVIEPHNTPCWSPKTPLRL